MGVRGKHGQGKTGHEAAYRTSSIEEIVHTIVELSSLCAESAHAGGSAWYEVIVYVHPHGLLYQVQRHGSVVGGETRHLPCGADGSAHVGEFGPEGKPEEGILEEEGRGAGTLRHFTLSLTPTFK